MGTSTVRPDPPLALVIGTDQPRLAPILAALVTAGYAVTTLAPTDDVAASVSAQAASLAVIERTAGGDTALLTIFRRLRQRPAFAVIEPEGLVLVTGFGTLARGPHPPEALPKLLRTHLGLEEAVVTPTLPLEPEPPVVIEPPPVVIEPPPVVIEPPPVVIEPPPVVIAPPPVVIAPPPVVIAPPPVVIAPPPVVIAPPVSPGLPRGSLRLPVVLGVLVLLVLLSGGFVLMGGFRTAMAPTLTPTTAQASPQPTLTTTTPVMATTPLSTTPIATVTLPITNLEIQIVAVSPNPPQVGEVVNVQVRVRNVSTLPITSPFWVDLYDSPTRLPAPLLPWGELAKYGATWRIERLAPGESRELNSLEADPTRSNLLKFDTPGPHRLYVLADTLSELPIARDSGQARPTYLGDPTEIVVRHAPTQP